MLFVDVLEKIEQELRPEFNRLIETAFSRQTHIGDLLIWYNNGFYDETTLNFKPADGKVYNPHLIGPGEIGHSEYAHYRFIDQYRRAYLYKLPLSEYLPLLEYTPERRKEIEDLHEFEETTINLEMLVYLKFWEADSIIKKFYELARIVNSEHYDWYFKIDESNRDKTSTGVRHEIIRKKIRDRFQNEFPIIYNAFKTAYKSQIRNAIAHSKYSFQQRNIHIHNYIAEDKFSQIKSVSFDEWIDLFHITTVIHNEYINIGNFVRDEYANLALKNNNILPVRITEISGKQYELLVKYRPEFQDWGYLQSK